MTTTTAELAVLAALPGPAHFRLDGKRALIVAAESPVGAAIARAYAEAGAEIALAVLRPDEAVVSAKRLQRELEALGAKSTVYVMDVTLGKNVQVTTRQIAKELGGIDVAVCASDLFLGKPIAKTTDSELQQVMAYNFNAHFFVARSASEEMRRGTEPSGGRIVLISHVLGDRGLPNTAAYAAAHGATQQLVRSLSQELAPSGVSINGISLGWMDWMQDRLNPEDDDAGRAVRFTVPRRAGTPEDVAPLALYLAGSGVGNVTGQVFHVDGGLTDHL